MNKLYVATRLENGLSDLICSVSNNREELENIYGTNIRDVIEYETREQALSGLREQLPFFLESVPAFLYDGMEQNGGFFEAYV